MENRLIILILGESTGLECLKTLINIDKLKISHVISADKKYNKKILRLCRLRKISFLTSKEFELKKKKINFIKRKKYFLISIFSSLILSSSFINNFKGRAYNFHPGLLPFYPGKNCVSGALYNKEKKSGVSLHIMTSIVDGGMIIKKRIIKVSSKDNLMTLMLKLKYCCIHLFKEFSLDLYKRKKFKKIKNNKRLIKNFPKNIPLKGKVGQTTSFSEFQKLYRASFSGPYKSGWGKIYFQFSGMKKFINYYKTSNFKLKNKLKKISKNIFIIKIKNRVLRVETNDN